MRHLPGVDGGVQGPGGQAHPALAAHAVAGAGGVDGHVGLPVFEDLRAQLEAAGVAFGSDLHFLPLTLSEPTLDDTMPDNERLLRAVEAPEQGASMATLAFRATSRSFSPGLASMDTLSPLSKRKVMVNIGGSFPDQDFGSAPPQYSQTGPACQGFVNISPRRGAAFLIQLPADRHQACFQCVAPFFHYNIRDCTGSTVAGPV